MDSYEGQAGFKKLRSSKFSKYDRIFIEKRQGLSTGFLVRYNQWVHHSPSSA
jgi:hypothetical protein